MSPDTFYLRIFLCLYKIDDQVHCGEVSAHWQDFPSLLVFRATLDRGCSVAAAHFHPLPIYRSTCPWTRLGFFSTPSASLKEPYLWRPRWEMNKSSERHRVWVPLMGSLQVSYGSIICLIPDVPLLSYIKRMTWWLCMNPAHVQQFWRHGHLMSHGQGLHLYQCLVTCYELFFE